MQTLLVTLVINKDFSCSVTITRRKTCKHGLASGRKIFAIDKPARE